jgi:NADH:ubiquinone oxidoreductase subunit 4 (subunit M)
LATSGVILSAAYMLTMIQRVFYCGLGPKSMQIEAPDLDAREHIALWPMVVLFLVMGVASPLWMRAIDTFGAHDVDSGAIVGITDPHYCYTHPCRMEFTAAPAKEAQ